MLYSFADWILLQRAVGNHATWRRININYIMYNKDLENKKPSVEGP
jgi:hypothetical protein